MTKLLIGIVILLVILPFNLSANVFASGITVTYNGTFPATIGYFLNENATSVQVIIREWPGLAVKKTITLGATSLGPNEVQWDGTFDAGGSATNATYVIEINASAAVGHTRWQQISYHTGPDSWFWSGAGLAANRRDYSPYFGMIYVAERTGGTSSNSGAILTKRGVYMFNAYGQYYQGSQTLAYPAGNSVIPWSSLAGYEGAPFALYVGPDDRVYAGSVSSQGNNGLGTAPPPNGGVAVGNALWEQSSVDSILGFFKLTNHGPISDVLVRGTGANRVLYTVEQTGISYGSDSDGEFSFNPDTSAASRASWSDDFDKAHIKSYNIGASVGTYTGTGVEVLSTAQAPKAFRIEMDSQGALYVVQQEIAYNAVKNTIYGLTKWTGTPGSMTQVWHTQFSDGPPFWKSFKTGNGKDSTAHNLDSIARASSFAGIGLDEKNGIVYVSRRNTDGRPLHNVIGYSMTTGISIPSYSFATGHSIGNAGDTTNVIGGGGNNIRDIAVDAAGNVIWINSSSEQLGVHSPPAGPNSFLTHSGWAIKAGTGVIATPADPFTSVEADYVGVPGEFSLSQNYPNPFNPETIIKFSIPSFSNVNLVVIDMLGREVKQLVNNIQPAGTHQIMWDGRDNGGNRVASGAYFYRLTASDVGSGHVSHVSVKMMLLLK
jgi:flagellar hook assembly protein FlgD